MDIEKKKAMNRRRRNKRNFDLRFAGGWNFTKADFEKLKKKVDYHCVCCYRQEPQIRLTIDHIEPLSLGGMHEINNIQPLCQSCNSKKQQETKNYLSEFLNNWQ